MVSKLPWAQKRIFWVFEKSIFQFFADFWLTKLKPFSGKERQSVKIYSNQNLAMRTFLEKGFEATLSSKMNVLSLWNKHFSVFWKFLSGEVSKLPWAQKRVFWAFEKTIFQSFANFWVTKLKPFSGKVTRSVQNWLNQNFFKGSFLENGFEATLTSKTNVLSVWKYHFSVFCKFLSDEVETIFWESQAKRSRLFKSKFGQRKLLRKWFRSYLELKNECSERLKLPFFSFLQIFEWRSSNRFLG